MTMKTTTAWMLLLGLAAAAPTAAQTSGTITYETRPGGKSVIYSGTVVEYVPRKTIVIRDSGQRVLTYTLAPEILVPEGLAVGSRVSLSVLPSPEGVQVVRKVSIGSEGEVETTTRTTETFADGSRITTTGTVVELVPHKTVVIRDSSDRQVTYLLTPEVELSPEIQVGKNVTISAERTVEGQPRVRRVTITRSVDSSGETRTVTRTETSPAGDASAELEVRGVVTDYKEDKHITLRKSDGTRVTYDLDKTTAVPDDLSRGTHVVLRLSRSDNPRIVRAVTLGSAHD